MQQRSEETHRRIVEAAQMLFAQQGYEATSVAEICQAAGVSKGAFYHHFPTKQAIFLDLLESWLGMIDHKLEEVRERRDSVPDTLVVMAQETKETLRLADGRLPMFLEFWTQARLDPAVWQATIAPYRRYQAYFTGLIEEGIEQGSIKDVDPALAARVIVSFAVGVLLQCVLDPQGDDWGRVVGQGVELLLGGMAGRSA